MSDIFDLDSDGAAALDDEARRNPLRAEDLPLPAWQNAGESAKGLLRPSASAGRTLLLAAPSVLEVFGSGLTEEGKDWYYRNVVDELGGKAVDAWTPDPASMGSASKALNVGGNVLGSIPQMIGMPGTFLASSGVDPAVELIDQGVDPNTAMKVGAVNLTANAIGMKIPAAWGNTLTQRLVTGAGANLAVGVAADAGSSQTLEAGGYSEQAASYEVKDPYARTLDLLMGAAFGWKANIDAPRPPPAQRDAVLTTKNNDHLHRQTLPGEPANASAARAHSESVTSAMEQLLRGEPVNVAERLRAEDFMLRPELARAMAPRPAQVGDFDAFLVALESGGNAKAKATTSSATGLHQFTNGTWLRTVKAAKPTWAEGQSDAQLLAMRTAPAKSSQMELALRGANALALERAGLEADAFNLYASHHFGEAGGVRFGKADGETQMFRILTEAQLEANPYLKGKTKAEAIANWTERARKAGVEVADAEPVRAIVEPAASMTGTQAAEVIDTRLAALDDLATQNRLPENTISELQREDTQIMDTLRTFERRQRDGIIPANPRDRLSAEQVSTMSARRVEIRHSIEAHRAAVGYENQAGQLRQRLEKIDRDADLVRLAERLSEPSAAVKQPARATEDAAPTRRPAGESAPKPKAKDGAKTAARVARPQSGGTEPQQAQAAPAAPTPLDDLLRTATEQPGTQAIVGFDADGAPTYRPLADALAEIQADQARAANDAQAYNAAVSCFIRMGS